MTDLEPIEEHLRSDDRLDPDSNVVVRGWPLTVDGMLRNADATRSRFSWNGAPLVAVSAEITVGDWTVDAILAGPRLRTRSRYAETTAASLVGGGFGLLPSFAAPHYSVVLPAYDGAHAQRLLEVLGEVKRNPHFVGRQQ
ncbi:MAG TPA: hypothetical protein VFU14_17440 [Acidimicrobiales bacterium]|nr:hypothetical protein [Acidimicrobiales bacterium]